MTQDIQVRSWPVAGPFGGSWALALRAIVGFGLMAHGYAKLSRGAGVFAGVLHALGVPAPDVMAWATILIELIGGLSVLVGGFVWVASIPTAAVLLVAMLTVHLQYGFSSIKLVAVTDAGAQFGPPGYEVDLLYIACLAALVLGGSGPFSVDRLIARRRGSTSKPMAGVDGTPASCEGRDRLRGMRQEERGGR
jgi:putative oxidoreductase